MTARDRFRSIMAERRCYPRGSLDYEYRTRAARQLLWIARGVPVNKWDAENV